MSDARASYRFIENKRIVPRDLSMDEEAVPLGEILGIATVHRTYYRGKNLQGEHVFVYMAWPEGGPHHWLVAASQRPQPAVEVRSYDYFDGWNAVTSHAFKEASQQLRDEMEAMTPPEERK